MKEAGGARAFTRQKGKFSARAAIATSYNYREGFFTPKIAFVCGDCQHPNQKQKPYHVMNGAAVACDCSGCGEPNLFLRRIENNDTRVFLTM